MGGLGDWMWAKSSHSHCSFQPPNSFYSFEQFQILAFPYIFSFTNTIIALKGLRGSQIYRVSPSGFPGHSDGLSPACFLLMVEKDLARLPFFLG